MSDCCNSLEDSFPNSDWAKSRVKDSLRKFFKDKIVAAANSCQCTTGNYYDRSINRAVVEEVLNDLRTMGYTVEHQDYNNWVSISW